MDYKFKRLFFDIETSPNEHLSWRAGYNINLLPDTIIKERQIICASWKWQHEDKVHNVHWKAIAIPKSFKIGKKNYKGYDLAFDDSPILEKLIPELDKADEIVYQNGDRFDLPWLRTRALFHRIPMQPKYKTFDTLKKAKSAFLFNSNKLDYVQKFLGKKGKISTTFDLWKKICLENDLQSLKHMIKYCDNDVLELEEYFNIIQPYVVHNTHVGTTKGFEKWTCAVCGTHDVRRKSSYYTAMGTRRNGMVCKEGHHYTISDSDYKRFLKERERMKNDNRESSRKSKKRR